MLRIVNAEQNELNKAIEASVMRAEIEAKLTSKLRIVNAEQYVNMIKRCGNSAEYSKFKFTMFPYDDVVALSVPQKYEVNWFSRLFLNEEQSNVVNEYVSTCSIEKLLNSWRLTKETK